MEIFELAAHEHIQLNQLLKLLSLVNSGGEANLQITGGRVMVNGAVEYQKRKKLRAGDEIIFDGHTIIIQQ